MGKPPEARVAEQPSKKRRLDETDGMPAAWNTELPPWVTEGAAVSLRQEQATAVDEVGVIMKITGSVATVRLIGNAGIAGSGGMAGGALGKERDLPTSMLVPIAPEVGSSVQVVGGNRKGCHGKLVGLAGASGIVQIGSLNYETLPLNQ